MSGILIVDDDPALLRGFKEILTGLGHDVRTCGSGEDALQQVAQDCPDVIVSDLCMGGIDGLEMFRRLRAVQPHLPVIIMTGHGTMDSAIEATKAGAFDYQLKPFEPEAMLQAIDRALKTIRLMQRSVELNPDSAPSAAASDAIVGNSREMQEVFKAIGRVAATDATVLIRGESGTGKELIARALFQYSHRSSSALMIVNCVALPEPLLESELFGHERGAFTGAQARRIGKFEQAQGGTIFLDEIGDISLAVQAKILRVLQQRTIERVGGNETISVDVRVIAATNRNLERAIAEGTFREDLFHRLNVVSIEVPALRDRRGDIPKLTEYFLRRYAQELQIAVPLLTDEALDVLVAFDWPGNVRELEHCIYRTLIFTRGYPIQASDVRRTMDSLNEALGSDSGSPALLELVQTHLNLHRGPGTHENLMNQVERVLICEALRRSGGNQTQAAQQLGMSRPTLHAKIQKHTIDLAAE